MWRTASDEVTAASLRIPSIQVRKTAMREVKLLKQCKHTNVVELIEVFRRKQILYLVFDYVERTVLEVCVCMPPRTAHARHVRWFLSHCATPRRFSRGRISQ